MKTASLRTYWGSGVISIAAGYPQFRGPGLPSYRRLAPPRALLKATKAGEVDEAGYRAIYQKTVLGRLKARKVWEDLHNLVDADIEPVICCYELLREPDDWCHRRMVADWFEEQLGVQVPEAKPTRKRPRGPQQSTLPF